MCCGICNRTQLFSCSDFFFLSIFQCCVCRTSFQWRPKLPVSGLESIHSHLLPRLSCLNSWENLNKRFYFYLLLSQIIPNCAYLCLCFTVDACFFSFFFFLLCEFHVCYGVECELLNYTCDGKRWCWKIFNCELHHWG